MEVLIAVIGIALALVLILTVMNHRERRTRGPIGVDESAILDARRYNDATAPR